MKNFQVPQNSKVVDVDEDTIRLTRFLPEDNNTIYNLGKGNGYTSRALTLKHAKKEIELNDKTNRYNGVRFNVPARKYAHTNQKIDKLDEIIRKDHDYKFSSFADFDSSKKIQNTNQMMDDSYDKSHVTRKRDGLSEDLNQNDYYNKYVKPQKYEDKRTQNAVDWQYVIGKLEKKANSVSGKKRPLPPNNSNNNKRIKNDE